MLITRIIITIIITLVVMIMIIIYNNNNNNNITIKLMTMWYRISFQRRQLHYVQQNETIILEYLNYYWDHLSSTFLGILFKNWG